MVFLNVGLGAVEVWIECNGQRLAEYGLKDSVSEGHKHQECHVASEEDKEFAICGKLLHRSTNYIVNAVDVYLDGVCMAATTISNDPTILMTLDGAWISPTEIRRFAFGRLTLKEDDGLPAPDAKSFNDLGTIRVQVSAVTLRPGTFGSTTAQLPGDTPVSEKAKKAGAHATRLGRTQSVPATTWSTSESAPGFPTYDVIFRYAPLALLYAREIIPRPPSPPRTSIPPAMSSSNNSTNQQTAPGPSNSKVKTEKGATVKKEKHAAATSSNQATSSSSGTGKKRTSDQAGITIELSSDEDNDDDMSALDPAERAAFIRMKGKLAQARVKKEKRVKHEPQSSFTPGEVITLSD